MDAPPTPREAAPVRFLLVSVACHLALVAGLGWLATPGTFEDIVPPVPIDLGLIDDEPGGGAEPTPPPAPAPPPPPNPKPVTRKKPPPPKNAVVVKPVDAGVQAEAADEVPDAGPDAATDGGTRPAGPGTAARAGGAGFGFTYGPGGLGMGSGGVPGAMIALHADLARIRDSSLVLETEALFELLPGWRRLLAGSGLDPLKRFERVFVGTPDLRRAHTVLAARVKGGEETVRQAAAKLGAARGRTVTWSPTHGVPLAPWALKRGPERVAALLDADRMAIARPRDVPRLLAIASALATRNASLTTMEHTRGAAALLAMREDEAVALSVEGARAFVTRNVRSVPDSLRISIRSLDEFHAELRAVGTYDSTEEAQRARLFIDALRTGWLDHPRVSYLGIRSALAEAEVTRNGARVALRMRLTLHQTRYLAAFVQRALKPRD